MVFLSFICASSGLVASAATVTTNFPDYPPGDTVWITGAGFAVRESVEVVVTHLDTTITGGAGHDPWRVKANNSGNFTTYWVIPYDDNVGETLQIKATGLSSGLIATTTFSDVNTILIFTGTLPDTICAGDTIQICANLKENCGGGPDAPLEGREILFFINPGNCGANIAQDANDSVLTDSLGNACGTIIVPSTPGNYTFRIKFRGEDKPDPCPNPGNSACDPNDPSANKRCVELSNSNECEPVVVTSDCCIGNTPPTVTAPDSTKFLCNADTIKFTVTATDADAGDTLTLEKISGPGTFTTVTGTSPLSGQLKHYVTASGTYTYIFKVTDECGSVDYDTAVWTVTLNSPPNVTGPADKNVFLCSLPATITVKPFTFSDPNNNIQSKTTNKGTLSGDSVYYTATTSGPDTIIVTVTDSCGAMDKDTVIVTKTVNSPPVVTGPADKNVFLCSLPASITVKPFAFSDPNNNIQSKTTNKGTLSGDSVYYTATTSGPDTIIVTVTDSCGALDKDTVIVTKTVNSPPNVTGPADKNVFLCSLPATITVKPFTFSDPNNNIQSKTTNKGTLSGDSVYYTATTTAPDTIIVTVTDSCGALDKDTVIVTKTLNSPPVVTGPADKNIFLCSCDEAKLVVLKSFTFSDVNNNIQSKTTNKGTLSGDSVYYTNSSCNPDTIIVTVTDSCGALDKDTVIVTKTLNSPPAVTGPPDKNVSFCSLPTNICVGPFIFSDPNNNIQSKTTNKGTLSGDSVCYTATTTGPDTIIVTVTDSCGAVDKDTVIVTKHVNTKPQFVVCPTGPDPLLCQGDSVCLWLHATDVDGDYICITQMTSAPGSFAGGSGPGGSSLCGDSAAFGYFCLIPDTSGTYNITLIVSDSCGGKDTCSFSITVHMNEPPQVSCPPPDTFTLCAPETVCVGPFVCSDPNNNVASSTVSFGTLEGGNVCFLPAAKDSTYEIKFICTDSCGLADTCITYVTVKFSNNPPVVVAPDSAKKLCNPDTIKFTVTATDVDAGDTLTLEKISGPGTFTTVTGVSPLSGQLKHYVTASGTYTYIFKVTDKCGAVDYDTAVWTVTLNRPPTVTGPADKNVFLCACNEAKIIVLKPFTFTDPDNNIQSKTTNKGALSGDSVYYTNTSCNPDTIIVTVTDSCGAQDQDTVIVTKTLNSPPAITAKDSTLALCAPDTIRIPVCASDPDVGDTICLSKTSGPGTFPGKCGVGTVCDTLKYYVTAPNTYTWIFKVTDKCGATDYDTATWVVTKVNQPPVVTAPDSTKNKCGPDNISFTVCASDPDAGDTITLEKVSGIGTFCTKTGVTPQCCTLTASVPSAGTYTWIFKVTNSCGAIDYDTATWTINFTGQPPVMLAGPDQNRTICPGDTICFSVSANHPTNNPVKIEKLSGPGNACPPGFVVNPTCEVCFAPPTVGQYCFVFKATEQNCNLTDEDTVCVNVSFSAGPIIIAPDTVKVCPDSTAGFPVSGVNPLGDSVCIEKISGPGSFTKVCGDSTATSMFSYVVPAVGCEPVVFKASSKCGDKFDTVIVCGDSSRCEVCIHVKVDCIEGDPGQTLWLPVLIQNNVALGGFDLVLEFFTSDLTVISVQRGDAIDDTNATGKFNWHYFTYRLDPSTVIHKYKIHLVGIGKLYSSYPGTCLAPNAGFVELFRIKVVLANNELLRCFQTPVFFEWDNFTCLENMFTDCSGNILYVSNNTSQFDPDSCATQDKNKDIINCVLFENGCVKFRCPHDVDPIVIGDVNVNGQPYEVGDAVLFSNYFVYGLSVFSSDYDTRQAQIGATDINRDGYVLSIADLVYLLRILIGDQAPLGGGAGLFQGLGNQASFDGRFLELSAERALGAVLFTFQGEGKMAPMAKNLTFLSNAENGQTKVLVYAMNKGASIPGGTTKLFSVTGNLELLKIEAADYYANPVEVHIASSTPGAKPTAYLLSQNYPNPFNATTQISFALPADANVSLKIYNLNGQVVKAFNEFMNAGYRTITWDGTNSNGEKVASGVYFYRLEAAGFRDVKKMTILK